MTGNDDRDLAATEARLRDAIGARVANIPDSRGDGGLGSIKGVVGTASARDRRRRRALAIVGIAAAIVIAAGSIVLLRDDKGQNVSTASDTPSTVAPTTVPGSTTVTTAPPAPEDTAIWPLASAASRSFDSPEAATFSFATEYLHMSDQVQVGTAVPTGDSATVDIRPFATGGPVTTVQLQQTARGWVVLGSTTPDVQVETPKAGDVANDPLTVSGQSTAFEAVINLELRPQDTGERVGEVAATMGGANGELGPFSTTLHPPQDKGPLVLLVYEADASGQGEISAATVVRLRAPGGGAAAPGPAPTTYVALSKSGDLTLLDFEGHVQRPLGSYEGAEELDYEPASGLVALHVPGGGCGSIVFAIVSPPGTIESSRTSVENARAPAFSPDGTKLAYVECSSGIHIRDLASDDDRLLAANQDKPFLSLTWAGNAAVAAAHTTLGFDIFDASTGAQGPVAVQSTVIAGRGRFGTVAYADPANIRSVNPATGETVPLVTPARAPVTLDADASGANLMWVDATGDVWTWSGGEPAQIASGMASAVW
jgi:hypothetical protein